MTWFNVRFSVNAKYVNEGYSPSRVPTSNMKRAPSLRYRASVAGSRPSDWEGVWAKSFLSQYQHGLMWSRKAWPDRVEFSLFSFIWWGEATEDGPAELGWWTQKL